jgi:hypothetical protein
MDLPPCHSRRALAPDGRVFFCAHPQVHSRENLVTAEVCRVCAHWQGPPPAAFRPFPPQPPAPPRGPCAHLGEQAGERTCPGCRGAVRLKVFACAHPEHGQTTLAECGRCPDFRPRAGDPPQGP